MNRNLPQSRLRHGAARGRIPLRRSQLRLRFGGAFFMCIATNRPLTEFVGMALRSKTSVFNAALLRCGRSPQDGSDLLTEAMEANYDDIVRAAFENGDGAFSFGKVRVTLTGRSVGTMGYEDAFAVPSDAIHILEVYLDDFACSDVQAPWEYHGETQSVLINSGTRVVSVSYVKAGLEHTWSSSFALGVQRRLEAVIKDVLEETEESSMKESEADAAFLMAGVKGSKDRSQRKVWKHGRLVRRRFTSDTRRIT
jgi:hypothetical protein